MTGSARMRITKERCRADASVGRAELMSWPAMPADAQPAAGSLGCELVAGHRGGHVALVATTDGGDRWWWLRWDERHGGAVQDLIQIDPCDAELQQGEYADDCFLPAGHPGPHSFDLPPLQSLPVERHPVRPRHLQRSPRLKR